MKKKIFVFVVIAVLLTFLTACSGGSQGTKNESKNNTSTTKPATSQKTSLTRENVHEWYNLVTLDMNNTDVEKVIPVKAELEPQGGPNQNAVYFNQKTGVYLEVWYRKESGKVYMKDIDLFKTDISSLFKKTYTKEHADQINAADKGEGITYDAVKEILGEEGVEVALSGSGSKYVWCNSDRSHLTVSFDNDKKLRERALFIKR